MSTPRSTARGASFDDATRDLVDLGIAHEQQHQELLLTDILHLFAQNPLKPALYRGRPAPSPAPDRGYAAHGAAVVPVGSRGPDFAFDCEGPPHEVLLQPFRLAKSCVTNREWAEFIAAGGYRDSRLWLSDGWAWVQREGIAAPLYWDADGSEFTLCGSVERRPDAPVAHLSYYEADAFATWAGARLPTEFEWEAAAAGSDPAAGTQLDEPGWIAPRGGAELFGDVWCWTASAFLPYPRFRPADGAVGEYNGKFMSGQMVLRGASCATPRGHSRLEFTQLFPALSPLAVLRTAAGEGRLMLHLATRDAAAGKSGDFADAVLAGLAAPQMVVPARFFYDMAGSELFEAITRLPEYYPTRTEIAILADHGGDIARIVGPGRAVVEFGSGSSLKTPPFLRAVAASAYVPIDISAEFLEMAATDLAAKLPELPVFPLAADFTRPLKLPAGIAARSKLGFFPGSTLGNMGPAAAVDLLRAFGDTLGDDTWLVIGLDLRKDSTVLEAAYNDAAGVTAAFNFNVLHRINAELDGTIDATAFEHWAPFNVDLGRIEMHLRAVRATDFTVLGQPFALAAGATIHTENSYKWTLDEARLLARAAGWAPEAVWTDAAAQFAVHLWRRDAARLEP